MLTDDIIVRILLKIDHELGAWLGVDVLLPPRKVARIVNCGFSANLAAFSDVCRKHAISLALSIIQEHLDSNHSTETREISPLFAIAFVHFFTAHRLPDCSRRLFGAQSDLPDTIRASLGPTVCIFPIFGNPRACNQVNP